MKIDYKQLILASQQRLARLTEIEEKINALPHHLRALVPHLDALIEVAKEAETLDQESKKLLPPDVLDGLIYMRGDAQNLRSKLAVHGNPLIAAVEPAPESMNEG